LKAQLADVFVERQPVIASQEDVQQTIAIVIADGAAAPVSRFCGESAQGRYILKIPFAHVAKQLRMVIANQQNVQRAVIVAVECRASGAKGVERRHGPWLLRPDVVQPALRSHIDERNLRGAGWLAMIPRTAALFRGDRNREFAVAAL